MCVLLDPAGSFVITEDVVRRLRTIIRDLESGAVAQGTLDTSRWLTRPSGLQRR